MIEQIEIRKTLQAGKDIWEEGTVLDIKDGPLPPDILEEVRLDRGTVKVLKKTQGVSMGAPPKIVVNNTSPTNVSSVVTNSDFETKPLKRRRRL